MQFSTIFTTLLSAALVSGAALPQTTVTPPKTVQIIAFANTGLTPASTAIKQTIQVGVPTNLLPHSSPFRSAQILGAGSEGVKCTFYTEDTGMWGMCWGRGTCVMGASDDLELEDAKCVICVPDTKCPTIDRA